MYTKPTAPSLCFIALSVLLATLSGCGQSGDESGVRAFRGAAVPAADVVPVGPGGPFGGSRTAPPRVFVPVAIGAGPGQAPDGMTPLPHDLFTTDDFYRDSALWDDRRYFRCASPLALDSLYGAYAGTPNLMTGVAPADAPWGLCGADYPREAIVSPYPFASAAAHYAALMAEAGAQARDTPPAEAADWTGRYLFSEDGPPQWTNMHVNQVPTILSLLTDDYQTRFVQMLYHSGVTHAPQWTGAYCWPEGFMRFFSGEPAPFVDIFFLPRQVMLMTSFSSDFVRQIHVGRTFMTDGPVPRLGRAIPRWYGESVGFWDGDTLVSWTSNIQGWTVNAGFEFSSQMQTIEIFSPLREDDGSFAGLSHETVFYDPEALVEPVRLVRNLSYGGALVEREPFAHIECNPTIFPVDGVAEYRAPGSVFETFRPDWFARPWAQVWERYHEEGMSTVQREPELFGF